MGLTHLRMGRIFTCLLGRILSFTVKNKEMRYSHGELRHQRLESEFQQRELQQQHQDEHESCSRGFRNGHQ